MRTQSRSGSVYLAVLFVVLTVSVLTLTGVTIRRMLIERAGSGNDAAAARRLALSGAEIVVQQARSDQATFTSRASGGTVFSGLDISPGTITVTASDADTGKVPTDGTQNFNLVSEGSVGESRSRIGFSLENPDDELRRWIRAEPSALAYWPMDEVGASTGAEIINNFGGVYSKSSSVGVFTHLHKNRAPRFAWSDEYMTASNRSAYQTPSGTLVFWVQFNTKPSFPGWTETVISKEEKPLGSAASIRIYLDRDKLWYMLRTSSSGTEISFNANKLTQGAWHHIAVSWGSNGMYLYLDGEQMDSKSGVTMGLNGSLLPLRSANTSDWVMGSKTNPLFGSVARVALFSKQLDKDEIMRMYGLDSNPPGPQLVPGSFVRVVD